MSEKVFSFSAEKFNKLFPFYMLIDNEMNVVSCGSSIGRLSSIEPGDKILSHFHIKKPELQSTTFESLKGLEDQLVVIQHVVLRELLLKGQLDPAGDDQLLFIGAPWLESGADLKEKKLTEKDFPLHDSVLDLLYLVKSQEIANNVNKDLLFVYNEQSKKLIQHEQELLNTQNKLYQLIANLQNAVLVEDETRHIVLANETFCKLFSIPVSPHDLVGADCAESAEQSKHLFADPEGFVTRVNELLKNKEKTINDILELKDGRVLSRDYIPVFSGDIYKGHLWKYTDVTESKLFERQINSQKQFYEQILKQIPADIAVLDKDRRYLYLNPLAIKDDNLRKWIIGKTDEEYCEYRDKDLSIAHDRKKIFDKTVASRQQREWEEQIKRNDGTTEYHLRKMYPVFNDNNELEIVIGYGIDITERKAIEEKIRLSEARYKGIFDYSLALICLHDLNGQITDVNKTVTSTLGYSKAALIGKKIQDLLREDKRAEFEEHYIKEIRSKGKAEGIMIARHKNGKSTYLLYQNYLVTDDTAEPYVIAFSQDITGRIDAERALKKSEEKYRSIIANMNLGLLEVDPDENIVYANPSFCEMSGYTMEELTGKNAASLFVPDDKERPTKEIINRRRLDESDAYELQVRDKYGDMKWWLISGAPVFDNNGGFKGSIGIHLDITLQKNLEQELRKAKSDAENSTRAKEIFLANMSHEIRTPMNAILGLGRLLAKTQMEPQQKLYLDTIQNASNNLLVIINDLLDFSKIEAGKISLENIGFKLNDIIDNAVRVLKHKAEEKGLAISYNYSPDIEPVLIGDPYRLNQVLMNLLSNSLKFTEQGEVKINCSLISNMPGKQKLLFQVSDTGIGMSEEFLNHLFDKFVQEDESITRKFGGTGLGMSISKQLIELMGGEIKVESKKNAGTVISFAITFDTGTKEDLPNTGRGLVDTQILKGKKILLVEDNDMNRLLAHTVLSQYGADVIEAEDGKIAIEKFERGMYDLILMDVQMPVKDGVETTKYIRANLDNTIPILALTANAFKQEEERCLQAGMNDFISKPFDEDKMVQLIAQWLGREINTVPDKVKDRQEQAQLYDLSKLRNISRGDDDFMNRMLELFIDEIPSTVNEMKQAADQADWKTLGSLAHRIKPSILNLGIMSISDDILSLEGNKSLVTDASKIHLRMKHVSDVLEKVILQLRTELQ